MLKCLVRIYLSVVLLLVTCFTPPATAEEEQSDVNTLEPMTVTARPIIEGNQTDGYGSVKTVITQEQLDDLNAHDLETALRKTPGVNMSRFNPVGSFGGAEGGGIFIRGMGSSRPGAEIKTLVDGVPMYMSVWNHPLLDLMSIDNADSIEVYKSPQPQYFRQRLCRRQYRPQANAGRGVLSPRVKWRAAVTIPASPRLSTAATPPGGTIMSVGAIGHRTAIAKMPTADWPIFTAGSEENFSDHWDLTVFTLWKRQLCR